MTFEKMDITHLPQIVAIEARSFEDAWTENMFERELSNGVAKWTVGATDGEVRCYGGVYEVLDEAQIAKIAVKEEFRGRGIGRELLINMLRSAYEDGARYATLEVRSDNAAALKLYKSVGFEEEGVRKRYYLSKYDAVLMRVDIKEDLVGKKS